jgi:hydrogenase expression/formation protein HypD
MNSTEPFRDPKTTLSLATAIEREARGRRQPFRLMEVCGTHTVAIHRYGLRSLLPDNVELISGPGCPVCVTPLSYIDHAVALARESGVTVCTFGDLMRVPGSTSSLERESAAGADVRVVTSPVEAVDIAAGDGERKVVFLGVGFETTTPAVALALRLAQQRGIENFLVLSGHKVMPPALRALVSRGPVKIEGFLLPGHVSAVIGSRPYQFLADEFDMPCVITGFEPVDVLQGIWMLLRQVNERGAAVEIQYRRAVRPEGNPQAQAAMHDRFAHVDATWRGIADIPRSGLALRPAFESQDAAAQIPVEVEPTRETPGCICGQVLQGIKRPKDCTLFGTGCRPESPIGACMVSSEGSCAAAYKYGRA